MRSYNSLHMRGKSPEILWIRLSEIDSEDSRYRIRLPWGLESEQLRRLIGAAGVVTPLRLEQRRDGAFRIVSGLLSMTKWEPLVSPMKCESIPSVLLAKIS